MKKRYIILSSILVFFIAIRITLPFIVKSIINTKISDMEGYQGKIEDVDLGLIRGAFVLDKLFIEKFNDCITVPFVTIDKIDISIHWDALFKGKLAAKVIFKNPEVNFAVCDSNEGKKQVQDGSGVNWVTHLKGLILLQINRVEIINGIISYKDFSSSPNVNATISNLEMVMTNLSNVENKTTKLPSTLVATANTYGSGDLKIEGKLNVLKTVPDIDINLKLENVQLTQLNDFLNAYAKFDAEKGIFNLYTEVLIDDGNIKGYVKPILEDVKIFDWNNEDGSFFGKIWEAIAGGIIKIFSNQQKDQFATEVPLSGSLNDLNVGVFPALVNILKNAFVEAFNKELEYSVGAD